jgi:L-ascorbate metabolism protein UlaG (beta-lactamase superfamily)
MKNRLVPHRHKNRFYNYENEKSKGFLLHTAYMLIKSRIAQKKLCPLKRDSWVAKSPVEHNVNEPVITWIGHSSFLIQLPGLTLLTDPVFGHASLLYRRILPPGLHGHELPPIDFVLLSHNHRDHMDAESLIAVRDRHTPTVLVPKGDKAWFDQRSFAATHEHTWWEQRSFNLPNGSEVKFTFLPAIHWSQRGFFDKNRSLWGSWMIEYQGQCFYFAGDTSYSPHFAAIRNEFPVINVALMPIGPCEPRAWMAHAHISAAQAGTAFLDLGAQHFIPMHWGTFPFGLDHFEAPIERLTDWWQENEAMLGDKQLHLPKIGQRLTL